MIPEMRGTIIVNLPIRCPKSVSFSNHRPSFRKPSVFHSSCRLPLLPCRSKSSTARRRVAYSGKKKLAGKPRDNGRDNAGDSLLNKITEIVRVGFDSVSPPIPGVLDSSKVGLDGRKGVRGNAQQSTILVNGEVPFSKDLVVSGRVKDTQIKIDAPLLDGTQSFQSNAENVDFENAETSVLERQMPEGVQAGSLIEEDVSPVVHRTTEIVRFDSSGIGMKDRLHESGVIIDPNIV